MPLTSIWRSCWPKLFTLFALTGLVSCAGTFRADVGMRRSTYVEKPKEGTLDDALSQSTGQTVVITEGDVNQYTTKANGPEFGFTYETEFLEQRLHYYSISYSDLTYTYVIDGSSPVQSKLSVKATGLDYKLAMKLWYLRPRISFSRDNFEITSVAGDFTDEYTFLGYGVGVDFHVYPGWHVYFGWDRRFKITSDPLFKISTTEVTFGLSWAPFSGGRGGGGGSRTSDHPFFDVF